MVVGRSIFATSTTQRKGSSPLQFPLSATAPMVWLPYTAIDQLLQALRESTTNHYNVVVGTAAWGKRKGARKHPMEGPRGGSEHPTVPCLLLPEEEESGDGVGAVGWGGGTGGSVHL